MAEPERVWLLQHALHPSLVFQDGPHQLMLYEYGEWRWFALGENAWYRVFPVFLWSTPGSLSRRVIPVEGLPSTRELVKIMEARSGWALDVERELAHALRDELHRRFAQASEDRLYNPELDTWFVPDPDSYHAFRTCNHVMNSWLRQLNVRVRSWLWSWNWAVDNSPDFYEP